MGHMLLHCGGFSHFLNLRGVPLEPTLLSCFIQFSLETLFTSVPWPACIEWAEGWCAEVGLDSDVG